MTRRRLLGSRPLIAGVNLERKPTPQKKKQRDNKAGLNETQRKELESY